MMAVIPPKVAVEAGVVDPDERWIVERALYGLPSSPADWGAFRDSRLKLMEWEKEDGKYRLQPTHESNLWQVVRVKAGSSEEVAGYLAVYVDDLLAAGPDDVVEGCLARILKEWQRSAPEYICEDSWLEFCGFELRYSEGRGKTFIAQPSYVKELLQRHAVTRSRPVPFVKPSSEEAPEVSPEAIRRAQGLVGELLWLSIRSRPDLAYGVSWMSQNITKNPEAVEKVGREMLEYLHGTSEVGLMYEPCEENHGVEDELAFRRTTQRLEVFADISFAPEGAVSHQGILATYGGKTVQWESGKQAFATLSTAEAELLGYCEGMLSVHLVAV